MFEFRYSQIDDWPPLAWSARLDAGCTTVAVKHGSGVEILDRGFCEAIWDGSFAEGRFDETDLVFGSGACASDRGVTFVSSGTTVDRLHWHGGDGAWTVSNSLACLLVETDSSVDPAHGGFFAFFESIIRGLDAYEKSLPTSTGPVQLVYYDNLRWDGQSLAPLSKPTPQRSLSTFGEYCDFLKSSFEALGENLDDRQRRFSLRPLATVSTGYDSPTGAAMARYAGLRETISISRGRGNVDDNGSAIASSLGLSPIVAERDEAFHAADLMPLFIASDAKGEDLYFAGSAAHLHGRVLISGYSGSRVWDTSDESYAALRRGDQSGLSHTEARLHLGYIHCPVPFFAGTQEADIRRLGRLPEMDPWSLDSDYNRPVCRRIVEEAGVAREAFGQEKKAASVLLFDRRSFLPPDLSSDFDDWLERRGLAPQGMAARMGRTFADLPRSVLRGLQAWDAAGRWPVTRRLRREGRLQAYAFHENRFDHLFPWALDHAMQRYHAGAEPAIGADGNRYRRA